MRNPGKALKRVGVSGVQVTHGDTRVTNLATRTNGTLLATSRCPLEQDARHTSHDHRV